MNDIITNMNSINNDDINLEIRIYEKCSYVDLLFSSYGLHRGFK